MAARKPRTSDPRHIIPAEEIGIVLTVNADMSPKAMVMKGLQSAQAVAAFFMAADYLTNELKADLATRAGLTVVEPENPTGVAEMGT